MPATWIAPRQQGFNRVSRLNDESLEVALGQPTLLVQSGPATTVAPAAWTALGMNKTIVDHGATPLWDATTNSWLPPRGVWRFSCVVNWDTDSTGTRRLMLSTPTVGSGAFVFFLSAAVVNSSSGTTSNSSMLVSADGIARYFLTANASTATARTATALQAAWQWVSALD